MYSATAGTLTLADRTIRVVQPDRGGVIATDKAAVELSQVTVVTMGADSAGLATAAGGGTITATGCDVMTSGRGSPCLYSRDVIRVTGGVYGGIRSEVAAVEPNGSLTITNASLSSKLKRCAILLAPALSSEKTGTESSQPAAPTDVGTASFTMSGGSIVYADKGAVFHVEGCTGVIELSGVKITALSDLLLKAVGPQAGSTTDGATDAVLKADRQTLAGDISADATSVIDLTLSDQSSLVGSIDPKDKAREIDLTLDASSTWRVEADSYVSGLSLAAGISGATITNIIGNGHTVYYDPSSALSSALAGQTYSLKGGGYLKPAQH